MISKYMFYLTLQDTDLDSIRKVLTDRQIQVVQLIQQNQSESQIATTLGISAASVRNHVAYIKIRLDRQVQVREMLGVR